MNYAEGKEYFNLECLPQWVLLTFKGEIFITSVVSKTGETIYRVSHISNNLQAEVYFEKLYSTAEETWRIFHTLTQGKQGKVVHRRTYILEEQMLA